MAQRAPGMTLSIFINLAGYTVRGVAAHLGVDKGTVSAWSSKRISIPPRRLQEIADFIQKDPEEIRPLVRVSSGKPGRPWNKDLPA